MVLTKAQCHSSESLYTQPHTKTHTHTAQLPLSHTPPGQGQLSWQSLLALTELAHTCTFPLRDTLSVLPSASLYLSLSMTGTDGHVCS